MQINENGEHIALYMLGCDYLYGNGVEPDYSHGIALVSQAANYGILGAQYELGKGYFYGLWGLPKRYSEAFRWLRKCDDMRESQFLLSACYLYGKGVEKDVRMAESYLVKSGNLSYDYAIKGLISFYGDGVHVPRNPQKEAYWRERLREIEE